MWRWMLAILMTGMLSMATIGCEEQPEPMEPADVEEEPASPPDDEPGSPDEDEPGSP